jgi:tetratricopeptide (TPR) repeat protein
MLETKKFQELEMVELLEDLPEYDLKKGEIGVVVEVFDTPSEAYDLEFVDESGRSSRFAYSLRPNQIKASEKRKRKANLRDVVEVAEDLSEYGVTRGEQGVVVEVFDEPDEGYILEFVDPSGTSSRLAYWVKPEQFKRVTPRKAQELEIVELTEDMPEYGVKKGERAVVITAFSEPDEAYDLEFVDESGAESRFAYSVRPDQIKSTFEIVKEEYELGMKLLSEAKTLEAEEAFSRAFELKPECLGNLHNWILESHTSAATGLGSEDELRDLIAGLRFVLRINPKFEIARHNMVAMYLNCGYEKAIKGEIEKALHFYTLAVGIDSPPELLSRLKNNFASAYTVLSIEAQQTAELEESLKYSLRACEVNPDEVTRHNLGAAYANLGWSHLDKRDYVTAIDLLQRAQDTGLQAAELFNNLGVVLAGLGRLDEATKQFEKAVQLSPHDKRAADNLLAMKRAMMNAAPPDELSTQTSDSIPIWPVQAHMSQIQPYQVAA